MWKRKEKEVLRTLLLCKRFCAARAMWKRKEKEVLRKEN